MVVTITNKQRLYDTAHFFWCPMCGNKMVMKGDKECDKCHAMIIWKVKDDRISK